MDEILKEYRELREAFSELEGADEYVKFIDSSIVEISELEEKEENDG